MNLNQVFAEIHVPKIDGVWFWNGGQQGEITSVVKERRDVIEELTCNVRELKWALRP